MPSTIKESYPGTPRFPGPGKDILHPNEFLPILQEVKNLASAWELFFQLENYTMRGMTEHTALSMLGARIASMDQKAEELGGIHQLYTIIEARREKFRESELNERS